MGSAGTLAGVIDQDVLERVLSTAMRSGADFAEIYAEDKRTTSVGLDDGRIELRVEERRDDGLVTVVVNGGPLGQHKGINAPGVALPAAALTEKDALDLRFGLALGVDLVAMSFVQTAGDVRAAIDIMRDVGRQVPVIAKIERPAGVENLEERVDGAVSLR